MKSAIYIACGVLGLAVLFVGSVLPMRLPRNERNLNRETLSTTVGIALACAPVFADRWKRK